MVGGKESMTLLPRDWDAKGLIPLVPRSVIADSGPVFAPGFQGSSSSRSGMAQPSES
jgi:hypothetical protein